MCNTFNNKSALKKKVAEEKFYKQRFRGEATAPLVKRMKITKGQTPIPGAVAEILEE